MSHRHLGGEEYEIRVRALADDDAPPIIRLRHVLKALLRHYNFRATSVRDITPKLPPASPPPLAQDVASASSTPAPSASPDAS